MVEMENCSTPPFDQKSYEETTTLFGLDDEDSVVKRRRKRRSLGRRVSFAETPAYHIFARDDDYVSPSHERQGAQESGPQQVPKRKSPRLASKTQAVDTDDKENWRPIATNLNDDCVKRRSKHPASKVEKTSLSPGPGPPSWHPARNTSSLTGDDGEISEFVDAGNESFRQKEHAFDEDVTLDSTTFTFKLSQLQNLKSPTTLDHNMLSEPASSVRENKGLRARRESPASGYTEHDMSMSFTMIKPISRANVLDLQPGYIDGNTDMSITMQVPRKKNSFLGIDATKQAEVIEILKATLSTKEGDGSVPSARLADLKSHTPQKILEGSRKKLTKGDEEIVVSETAPSTAEIENIMGSATHGGIQNDSFALAAVTENEARGKLFNTADCSQSVEDGATTPIDHNPEGLIGNLHCPVVCHGYDAEIPGLTASYQNDEATRTMDISVSPTATMSLANGGCKPLPRELDRSITMDIPSLQDLVREEEDEDMITDMKMGTEVIVSRLSELVGNSPTNASRESQGLDGKTVDADGIALVEKDLRRATSFWEEGSQSHRDEIDQDRSIILCVPRLQDIIRKEEEDEDSTVLEGLDLAVRNVSLPSSQCGNQNTPSSSDGYFSESITAQIPRCSDLLVADSVSPNAAPAWNKSRRTSWVAPPPSCLATTHFRESKASGNVPTTPLADSDMEIIDDSVDPILSSKDIASIGVTQDSQLMHSSSTQIVDKDEIADFQVVHSTRLRSSPTFQNVTPTSASGESMDVVGDTTQSMLHLSSVRPAEISKQDESCTPSDCSAQMVITEDTTHRQMPSDSVQILEDFRDHGNKSSDWSGQSVDTVPEAANAICHLGSSERCKLSRGCEKRPPTDGFVNSTMIIEDTLGPKSLPDLVPRQFSPRVDSISPSTNSKPSRFVSLYLNPDRHTQNEARVRDYRSYTPSPIPRTLDAKEVINSVLKSAARLATTPQASVHKRIANLQSRIGSTKSRFTAAGESKNAQPLVANFTVVPFQSISPGRERQRSPKTGHYGRRKNLETPRCKDSTEHQEELTGMLFPISPLKKTGSLLQSHLPLSTIKTVDQNLSFSGHSAEQQDPFSIPRERVTLLFNSGNKIQLSSGKPTKENTGATSFKEVVQACSQADGSPGQRVRVKDGDNISVEEFLKLAEVRFYAKPGKSSPVTTDHSLRQADGVTTIHDAFRLSLLVKPQIMHMEDACNLVQDGLQKLRVSEARLEEALSASNPSLFSRLQTAGAADKERLKEQIDGLQNSCRLKETKSWVDFRLRLEDYWRVKLLQSRKEIQSYDQALLEGNRFVEENYKQIQNLQARIRTKASKGEEYPSDKATSKPRGKKAENKCALDKIDYLKERLADIRLSRKEKVEKLLKRTQITEEVWRGSKERLESVQCRVHDLQTKLAENVRMGHSQAGGLQIAARPDFYVKEMVNKVSLLKTIQDGWDVKAVGHDMVELSYSPVGHGMVELSYSPIIRKRLLVTKSLDATKVTKSNWDLDLEKIDLIFPGINAIEAFQRTLTDGADYVLGKLPSLRSCIQGTRFLVSNFVALMEEVGRCQDVTNAVAGRGVLVIARFHIENDKHLQLGIKFLDILLSAKFILSLDLRSAQLNGYPFGAVPTKVDIRFCPPKVSHKLTSAVLEAALATVKPGYNWVERLCATVGSLLASIKK